MGTASNIIVSTAAIYVGTAGSTPATYLGYCAGDSVSITFDEEFLDAETSEKVLFVKRAAIKPTFTIKCESLEATMDNMSYGLPAATLSGSTITRTSTNTTVTPCSVKVVGVNASGAVRTYQCLYAYAKLGEIKLSPKEWVKFPLEFEAYGGGDTLWTVTDGSTDSDVTLATGTFARVAALNYYVISGEGAAADVMTNITGTLVADELFYLRIASATMPITMTDLADTLELDPSADWIMTSVNDLLILKYEASETQLREVGRIKYVA
jgi:hypothetical protein